MEDLTTAGHAVLPELPELRAEYADLCDRGLRLDLTRGKPSPEQLDLARDMLTLPGPDDFRASDGTDCRNYGGLAGLTELREIFAEFLQVPAGQLMAWGNSSLTLMHDCIMHALLFTLPGSAQRWLDGPRPAFLCPVPGYDRHFAVCEKFGIDMIPVPMTDDGPDTTVVGYFLSLDVPEGCAAEVVRLATQAGIALTPAGATHPGGHDPQDRTIRLAPTFPALAEVEQATRGVVTCVLLAAAQKLNAECPPAQR